MKPVNFIDSTAVIGTNVTIWHFAVILADVCIESNCSIGSHVEIGRGSLISHGTRIGKGTFLPTNSVVGENVFIGPNVTFCDDKYPKANNPFYKALPPIIGNGASIGAGSVILPGIQIGEHAVIGAGSIITHNVLANSTVYGTPALERAATSFLMSPDTVPLRQVSPTT